MGVEFTLVNHTKKEKVSFNHLTGSKKRELVGNPDSAATVTWYLLQNIGDEIGFVSDTQEDWPFSSGSISDLVGYTDQTDRVIQELIEQEILRDDGFLYQDEDDPETIFIRKLTNIWRDDET